jgi:membrane-bound ClpP family serine protease
MDTSRILVGMLLTLIGLILVITSVFTSWIARLVLLMYGIPALILGIFILFNKKEDEIEQIKKIKKNKN